MTNNKHARLMASLFLLLLTGIAQVAFGQTAVTLVNNGDPANRVDMVIVSEGYTAGEMNKFVNDVQSLVTSLFTQEPYREYQRYFNVYRVEMASNESGADHPERTPPVAKDTAFDATYNCRGIQRLICVNNGKVTTAISGVLGPAQRDVILVLVNDSEYGGSGGAVAVASTHADVVELTLHEQGHSFGLLADEYGGPPPPACNAAVEPAEANATRQTVRALIKWMLWINAGTPLPTTTTTAGVPGLYEGANYCDMGLFRPTSNSKMRTLDNPFEQVNSEQLIRRIYNFASPIDSSLPVASNLTLPHGATQNFSVATPSPFTHTLDVTWLVDGVVSNSGLSFTLNTGPLSVGNHTVDVVVRDNTTMVRSDPAGVLTESRRWNVTVQAVADLAITKSDSPDPVVTGSNVTYTIRVTNNGSDAAPSVVVTDNLPSATTFVSCTVTGGVGGVCGGSGNNRMVTFTSLAASAFATITIEARIDCALADGATFSNTAMVSSAAVDSNPANNSATELTRASNPPPVIVCPANLTRPTDPGLCTAVVTFAPMVTDNCPGVTVVCVPASGFAFPKGTTTVTCTATDVESKTASCSFAITVVDTEKPQITCPSDINTTSCGSATVISYPDPVATDNCPGVTTACVPPSGFAFSPGVTTVICTATDTSGNTSSCGFKVSIEIKTCDTVCFYSPQYYLFHLNNLPRGAVLIGGVNYNSPVSTRDIADIKQALQGNAFGVGTLTPLQQLNQEFVAAQLSMEGAASDGGARVFTVMESPLHAWGLNLVPVPLGNGFIVTRDTPMKELFAQARSSIFENRPADMVLLAAIFDLLNGNDIASNCGPLRPKPDLAPMIPDGAASFCAFSGTSLRVTIKNQGDVAAPATITAVTFGNTTVNVPTPALLPNQWVELNVTVPAGGEPPITIKITADAGNALDERNKLNNVATLFCP